MVRRARILADFRPYVREAYRTLAGPGEEADMTYSSAPAVAGGDDEAAVEAGLRERLTHMRHEELRRRTSLVGPHRDDVRLEIGGLTAHQYASQGQHKSLLIALKMAEFVFLRERTGEAPVLLLDDVFSELDPVRARRLVELVRGLGQTIITTTDDAGVRDVSAARFEVSHGTIGENTR
jgi:DNA replication and repair protein RecF